MRTLTRLPFQLRVIALMLKKALLWVLTLLYFPTAMVCAAICLVIFLACVAICFSFLLLYPGELLPDSIVLALPSYAKTIIVVATPYILWEIVRISVITALWFGEISIVFADAAQDGSSPWIPSFGKPIPSTFELFRRLKRAVLDAYYKAAAESYL